MRNHNQVIHRNVTTHTVEGIKLTENTALIASFHDSIKVTHKGKYLETNLQIMLKKNDDGTKLNIQFKLAGKKIIQGVTINMLLNIESNYNIDLK